MPSHTVDPPVGGTMAISAAIVGNALEWFDFTVYGLFSIYIAKAFFPAESELASLLLTLATYGVGFVLRPVGAILLGQYADRTGRKAALTLIILMMLLGSAMIAFAPTYAQIGPVAPVLIVLARLIQGFSVGGEMGGATAYLLETAPANRRGFYASWQYAGQAGAALGGGLLAFALTRLLGPAALYDWGWRVPFVLGLSIGPVGLYLRFRIPESPAFLAQASAGRAPLGVLWHMHKTGLFRAFCLTIQLTACTYLIVIYMPTYAIHALGFAPDAAFTASSTASFLYLVMNPVAGRISDSIGRPKQLLLSSLALLVLVYPAFLLIVGYPSLPVLLVVQGFMAVVLAMYTGPAAALVGEMFPSSVRSTGLSLSYNIAVPIFGGFAPYFVTRFDSGSHLAPAYYMIACAIPTIATLLWMRTARD
ncbi:MAG: Major facilitator transporter [Rhodospirillales bacterium]|nr:Major facilitator transporter [Rhodospirillales bacterium]